MGFTLLPFVKESLWFDSYMCVVVKLSINLCARTRVGDKSLCRLLVGAAGESRQRLLSPTLGRVDMCGERRAKA